MGYCLLSGRLFMSVIAVLLFVAVTSYGNNLGKAPIQFNKECESAVGFLIQKLKINKCK